jgi:hypothetical protein
MSVNDSSIRNEMAENINGSQWRNVNGEYLHRNRKWPSIALHAQPSLAWCRYRSVGRNNVAHHVRSLKAARAGAQSVSAIMSI